MVARSVWPTSLLLLLVFMASIFECASAATRTPSIALDNESSVYEVLESSDFLNDPGGDLLIDQVDKSTAFHRGDAASQPTDDGVRWYKFRYRASTKSPNQWFLSTNIACSYADLYARRDDGLFAVHPFGYRAPFARHPAPGSDPAIDASPFEGQLVYVRLQCEHDRQRLYFASASLLARNPYAIWEPRFDLCWLLLIILTFGLALITRSVALALAALSGVGSLFYSAPYVAAHWFPDASLPAFWLFFACTGSLWAISMCLYYDNFLELGAQDKRLRQLLLLSLGVGVLTRLLSPLLPLRIQDIAFSGFAGSLLSTVLTNFFMFAGVIIAFIVARAGNRSAWFTAAGAASFVAASAPLPSDPTGTLDFIINNETTLPDFLLLIMSVGDRLRQTSLARERAISLLAATQSSMLERQADHIADLEFHRTAFARFVPTEFLEALGRDRVVDVQLGDHIERDMAVLFTDIRGFTSIAEEQSPRDTFDFLNAYLARAGPVIRANNGFVDKYVGDAIVALFPGKPEDALDAAIALQSEVRRYNEDRARRGDEPIAVGVGVNFGRMMLGTIGENERFETTVIADSVNVASRLEGLTKVYGVSIIVSASIVSAIEASDEYCLRKLGELELRGHRKSETAFELFDGDPHGVVLHKRRTHAQFEDALRCYEIGDYARSRELFTGITNAESLDTAASYLRDRSSAMEQASTTRLES